MNDIVGKCYLGFLLDYVFIFLSFIIILNYLVSQELIYLFREDYSNG